MSGEQQLFTRPLADATSEAHEVVRTAVATHKPRAVCLLFSGGRDSSVLLDVCQTHADYVVFIDTGIGLDVTRQFVHDECDRRDADLIVERPDLTYEDMVVDVLGGFPGPPMHRIAYQRLKERALRKVRRRFVQQRGDRVLFLTGIRMDESNRRMARGADQAIDREGSSVWANPLLYWDNAEMAAYRRERGLRVSPAYEHIHMSGECLCGAFGSQEELAEIEFFYPDEPAVRRIRELEAQCRREGLVPCEWGPGRQGGGADEHRPGRLCSGCELRIPGLEATA